MDGRARLFYLFFYFDLFIFLAGLYIDEAMAIEGEIYPTLFFCKTDKFKRVTPVGFLYGPTIAYRKL